MITAIAALAMIPVALDKWDLKADLAPKSSTTYAVTVNVEMDGQPHEAKVTMLREVESADTKEAKVKVTWKDIKLDDQPIGEDRAFPLAVNLRGAVTKSTGEFQDDERRMLSVLTFVCPEKGVDVGDKWTYENKPEGGKAHTAVFEVKAIEKVADQDAMKISCKLDEKEDADMHADGFFWVNKAGKVLKWETKIRNWTVPMAGAGAMDVKMKGELVPTKGA